MDIISVPILLQSRKVKDFFSEKKRKETKTNSANSFDSSV